MPTVGDDPITPLLPVVAPSVPLEASALDPVRRVGVAVPDVRAQRVQLVHVRASRDEPEQLGEDRAEREPFRRHGREAVAHAKAHDLAEDRARSGTGAVVAIDAALDRLAKYVKVLTHDLSPRAAVDAAADAHVADAAVGSAQELTAGVLERTIEEREAGVACERDTRRRRVRWLRLHAELVVRERAIHEPGVRELELRIGELGKITVGVF